MNEEQASSIIEWYNTLEKRLLDFFEYIPLNQKNLRTVSPRLVSIALESCVVLDSVFRHFSFWYRKDSGVKRKKDDLKIHDHRRIYSQKLRLSTLKTLVLAPGIGYVTPFSSWQNIGSATNVKPPHWWTIYNRLKHGRIGHERRCTVRVTVEALGGLQQAICRLPELLRAIISDGWIAPTLMNPDFVEQEIGKGISFIAASKLFATPVGPKNFPPDIEQLSPAQYNGNQRLETFLGRQ